MVSFFSLFCGRNIDFSLVWCVSGASLVRCDVGKIAKKLQNIMAKITLILDTRHANVKGLYPIRFRLSHNSSYTSIGSGVAVKAEHWIGEINRVVKSQCPNAKRINEDIETLYYKFSNALRDLELSSSIRLLSVTEVKR